MDKQKRLKIKWGRSTVNTVLVLLMLTVGMSSCYYRENEVIRPVIPDTISYSEDIQPIWDIGCNSSTCHGGRWNPDLSLNVSYNALIGGGYVNEAQPESSSIYTVCIPGGSMAQYTASGDAEKILKWIEEGALNN